MIANDPSHIPSRLPDTGGAAMDTADKTIAAMRFWYECVTVLDTVADTAPDGHHIKTNFLSKTAQQIGVIAGAATLPVDLVPAPSLEGLYLFLRRVSERSSRESLRTRAPGVAAHFTDMNKNERLTLAANYYRDRNNVENQDSQSVLINLLYIAEYYYFLVEEVYKKAIFAGILYRKVLSWYGSTDALVNRVTEMEADLSDRTSTNEYGKLLLTQRRDSQEAYLNYINYAELPTVVRYNRYIAPAPDDAISHAQFKWENFEDYCRSDVIFRRMTLSTTPGCQPTLYDDPHIKEKSSLINACMTRIHRYVPGPAAELRAQASRLKTRNQKLIDDAQGFLAGNDKNVVRANALLKALEKSLEHCESYQLKGGEFTEESLGITPDTLAGLLEQLHCYVNAENARERANEQAQRAATMEYSKMVAPIKLPPLKSPGDFLTWQAVFLNIKQVVTSDLQLTQAIKQSLGDPVDKKFLANCFTAQVALDYLFKKYSDVSFILAAEMNKIDRMPLCKDSVVTMLRNSQDFLVTVKLFRENNMVEKIDNACRQKLVDRIFTKNQKDMFEVQCIQYETIWQAQANPTAPTIMGGLLVNPNTMQANVGAPPHFHMPSVAGLPTYTVPTIGVPATGNPVQRALAGPGAGAVVPVVAAAPAPAVANTAMANADNERILENQRRELFLTLHWQYYEASRRSEHGTSVTGSKSGGYGDIHKKKGSQRRDYNFAVHNVTVHPPPCPTRCGNDHRPNLFYCPDFRRQSLDEMHRVISNSPTKVCKRCLEYGFKEGDHDIRNGQCPGQAVKNISCKNEPCKGTPLALTHSQIICRNTPSAPKRSTARPGPRSNTGPRPPRNGGPSKPQRPRDTGARGGARKGNGQFKRPNRKARISSSQKAYAVNDQPGHNGLEDDEVKEADLDGNHAPRRPPRNHNFVVMVKGHSYRINNKSKHQCRALDNLHATPLPHTSMCRLQTIDGRWMRGLALFDSASSITFIKKSVAEKLGLVSTFTWTVELSTLTTKGVETLSGYHLRIQGLDGVIYSITAYGCDDIGCKDEPNPEIIKYLCKLTGVSASSVDLSYGNIGILLGTADQRTFPIPVPTPIKGSLSAKHPDIQLFKSRTTDKMILSGMFYPPNDRPARDIVPVYKVHHSYMIGAVSITAPEPKCLCTDRKRHFRDTLAGNKMSQCEVKAGYSETQSLAFASRFSLGERGRYLLTHKFPELNPDDIPVKCPFSHSRSENFKLKAQFTQCVIILEKMNDFMIEAEDIEEGEEDTNSNSEDDQVSLAVCPPSVSPDNEPSNDDSDFEILLEADEHEETQDEVVTLAKSEGTLSTHSSMPSLASSHQDSEIEMLPSPGPVDNQDTIAESNVTNKADELDQEQFQFKFTSEINSDLMEQAKQPNNSKNRNELWLEGTCYNISSFFTAKNSCIVTLKCEPTKCVVHKANNQLFFPPCRGESPRPTKSGQSRPTKSGQCQTRQTQACPRTRKAGHCQACPRSHPMKSGQFQTCPRPRKAGHCQDCPRYYRAKPQQSTNPPPRRTPPRPPVPPASRGAMSCNKHGPLVRKGGIRCNPTFARHGQPQNMGHRDARVLNPGYRHETVHWPRERQNQNRRDTNRQDEDVVRISKKCSPHYKGNDKVNTPSRPRHHVYMVGVRGRQQSA